MSFKPKNCPGIIPYLTVQNAEKSIDFYERAFGFRTNKEDLSKDELGNIVHAELFFHDVMIMLSPEGAWGSSNKAPVNISSIHSFGLYVYCPNVDAFYKNAIQNGAESLMEPQDMFWGDRMCRLRDIDGFDWVFGTYINKE
jgi:uncharacterized glyoxalase superfamily protein PhnB